jgi:catechol 2,3-dioxygenase-like lactoylglutathione lyase family enzyme
MIGLGVLAVLFAVIGAGKPVVTRRPPIVGIAHIGLKTDNLAVARKFYGDTLGFQEMLTEDKPTRGLTLTYFKVNDHQYIELISIGRPSHSQRSQEDATLAPGVNVNG